MRRVASRRLTLAMPPVAVALVANAMSDGVPFKLALAEWQGSGLIRHPNWTLSGKSSTGGESRNPVFSRTETPAFARVTDLFSASFNEDPKAFSSALERA